MLLSFHVLFFSFNLLLLLISDNPSIRPQTDMLGQCIQIKPAACLTKLSLAYWPQKPEARTREPLTSRPLACHTRAKVGMERGGGMPEGRWGSSTRLHPPFIQRFFHFNPFDRVASIWCMCVWVCECGPAPSKTLVRVDGCDALTLPHPLITMR